MFAIVGLGNPGQKYEGTRHNVGFRVIDELAARLELVERDWSNKFNCSFAKVRLVGEPAVLVKPQGYMNLSGECLAPLIRFFKIDHQELVVAYDELDLPCGTLRLKRGGSAAGHGGLGDILEHLSTDKFYRVRVGIGRPGDLSGDENQRGGSAGNIQRNQVDSGARVQSISSWVLGQPRPKEKELLDKAVRSAAEAIEMLLQEGLAAAQQRFHSSS